MSTSIVLKKDTITRLIKDVKEIITNPLTSHGIYYHHNEADILKGEVLIIGPKDTPYENGYYLFEISYPVNYPFSPPVVKYYTNDGITRFNPNLYKCGKVCLSILNTWRGDQWSSCQTISSVLLALCTIFNNAPLLNEPGISAEHLDFKNYNMVIEYKNFEIGIMHMFRLIVLNADADANANANANANTDSKFNAFKDIIKTHFLENYKINKDRLDTLLLVNKDKNNKSSVIHIGIYSMFIPIDYENLKRKFQELH